MAGLLAALALGAGGMATAEPPGTTQASAQTDTTAGKRHFIRCVACHSVSVHARPLTGPHLEGIVGCPVASVEGFRYTEALSAKNFIWDEARLDNWLKAPQAEIAGLCLPFMGLAKAEDRAALITYLKNP